MLQSGELAGGLFSSWPKRVRLTDEEIKKRAHGTPKPLPGSLATASLFHPIDRHPDPDPEIQAKERLEDLQRYEPETWRVLMETYGLPASTEAAPESGSNSNEGVF